MYQLELQLGETVQILEESPGEHLFLVTNSSLSEGKNRKCTESACTESSSELETNSSDFCRCINNSVLRSQYFNLPYFVSRK